MTDDKLDDSSQNFQFLIAGCNCITSLEKETSADPLIDHRLKWLQSFNLPTSHSLSMQNISSGIRVDFKKLARTSNIGNDSIAVIPSRQVFPEARETYHGVEPVNLLCLGNPAEHLRHLELL